MSLYGILPSQIRSVMWRCMLRPVWSLQTRSDSTTLSVGCMKRFNFPRMYPTLLVLPDGSTVTIRYKEPRQIITLPLDINTLTPGEKQKRLSRRRPRTKIVMDDFIEDSFDVNKYVKIIKKSNG